MYTYNYTGAAKIYAVTKPPGSTLTTDDNINYIFRWTPVNTSEISLQWV